MVKGEGVNHQHSARRIAVVGTAGSGKTTLARRLAGRLDIPHVELDSIHWGPNWEAAQPDAFRELVSHALSGKAWTIDGNYRVVRDIVWARTEQVVWLDYPLPVIMERVTRRTFRRIVTCEELWSGNRESIRGAFFRRDGIIWWPLLTYRRRRREFPMLFAQPEYAHLDVVRLQTPRDAEEWLAAQGKSRCIRR